VPVDVVGDPNRVNVHELKIQPPKDIKQNFITEALGEEKIEKMKEAVRDTEEGSFRTAYLCAAALIMLGKMRKEDIPGYPEKLTWDIDLMIEERKLTQDPSPDYILLASYSISSHLFDPERQIEFYRRNKNEETRDYQKLKNGVTSNLSLDVGAILTAMAICFPQKLDGENRQWKEEVKNLLKRQLYPPHKNRKLECAAAYRLMFPEDDLWKSVIEDAKQRNVDNFKVLKVNFQGIAEEIIYLRLLTADRVEVTNNGLIVEDNKVEDKYEQPLPERKKY